MIGTWTVESYSLNGADQTTAYKARYANYSIDFDASNNYVETYVLNGTNTTNAGPWIVTNGGSTLQLTNRSNDSIRQFHINSITNNTADLVLNTSLGAQEYHYLKH